MAGAMGFTNERREMMRNKFLIFDFGMKIANCQLPTQQSLIKAKTWFLTLTIFLATNLISTAQPYQKDIRNGNKAFEQKSFADAEVNYKKAAEANPEAFEGWFNLGDALYKQGRFDEALEAYEKGAQFTTDKKRAAATFHNIGNAFAQKKELEKASEAYKQALRLNPNDQETRYNLAKTIQAMRQQQNQQENKDDKKDENQEDDKKENKEQDKNQKKDDPKNDKNDPQKESDENDDAKKNEDQPKDEKQDKDKKQGDGEQKDKSDPEKDGQPQKMSKEEMERLLEAIANAEKNTRAKLDKKKKVQVKTAPGVKDW